MAPGKLMKYSWLTGLYTRKYQNGWTNLNFWNTELCLLLIIGCVSLKVGIWSCYNGWSTSIRIHVSIVYIRFNITKHCPSHHANFMCIKLMYVSCQHFRHNLRPTFRRNVQAYFQAEPEIKYHAPSTSILNITGYNFILLPAIYHILNAHVSCHLIQVSKNRP